MGHIVQKRCNSSAYAWCHIGRDSVSNHQPHNCLLNRLFRHRSKKTSKLRVTGLCAGNSLVTSEFPAQMASKAENVSIWWHHHVYNNPSMYWCLEHIVTVTSHGHHSISNHWQLCCLFCRLSRCTSKKTSKLCVTGLYEGNPPDYNFMLRHFAKI